jgi:hypothetical protein
VIKGYSAINFFLDSTMRVAFEKLSLKNKGQVLEFGKTEQG